MITGLTSHRLVASFLSVRPLFALWFIPYFLIEWFYHGRPDEIPNSLRLQWYLLLGMWCVFLLSLTFGHIVRTVLMLVGIALLALASFPSFNTRWFWLAGFLLIAGVLFLEALPRLRKIFASFREAYRKISNASDT